MIRNRFRYVQLNYLHNKIKINTTIPSEVKTVLTSQIYGAIEKQYFNNHNLGRIYVHANTHVRAT